MGTGPWTIYLKASGPASLARDEQFNLLTSGDFGGAVIHVGSGQRSVSVVVEVNASTEEAASELVIGKMRAALGPDWTIELDPA